LKGKKRVRMEATPTKPCFITGEKATRDRKREGLQKSSGKGTQKLEREIRLWWSPA